MGSGQMLGDFEAINQMNCQFSVRCESSQGKVWRIKSEDFHKIRQVSDEQWNLLGERSMQAAKNLTATYMQKITQFIKLRQNESSRSKDDMHAMCQNLMKEMLWEKPPSAIEMFSIRKHIQEIPALKNMSLSRLGYQEYSNLRQSKWAKTHLN
jgi:hypothetical protein